MPRELIKSDGGPYHVKLGWDHIGGVQLGVELENPNRDAGVDTPVESAPTIFNYLLSVPSRTELGRLLIEHANEGLPSKKDAGRAPDCSCGPNEGCSGCPAPEEVWLAVGNWIVEQLNETTHHMYFGLWSDLDRRSINDLIRKLRRARDTAFGKDE